jgi:phage terminase small subunit
MNTDYEFGAHHLKTLQVACETWDRRQQARRQLDLEGLTVATEHGIKTHPAIAIEKDCSLVWLRCLRELNLEGVELPEELS